MASLSAGRITAQGENDLLISVTNKSCDQNCARCGGLLVRYVCMDLDNTGTELDIPATRCVQCGDVLDSVILHNRRNGHESSIARHSNIHNRF